MKTVIKNGIVVTSGSSFRGDVLIEGEKIAAIGRDLHTSEQCEYIDATGKYVLPGAIDPHTHIAMPYADFSVDDDFASGTTAAACGGVTCIVDHAVQRTGEMLGACIERKRGWAEGKAVIDYSFHADITDPSEAVIAEIGKTVREYGVSSFKVYMVYDFKVDDRTMIQLLEAVKRADGLMMVHAENSGIIEHLREKHGEEGTLTPEYHPVSRPCIAEAEAVSRAIRLTEFTGSRLYIVHLSSAAGLSVIEGAHSLAEPTVSTNSETLIFAETCPQYLLLTEELYKLPGWEGAKYVMSPPLRSAYDNEALWRGLASGSVQTVATDHAPFRFHGKKDRFGTEDYRKIPNGSPGVETMLMLLHSEGVVKGRIPLEKMVELTAGKAAELFGLTDKGKIEVGRDADIVLFDPKKRFTITAEKLHMNVDYTPFEGWDVTGMPELVFSRGEIVARWKQDRMEPVRRKGRGRFVKRSTFGHN